MGLRDQEVLLDVRELTKHYPIPNSKDLVHAVNQISFQIKKGEVLGLVGESGSGKTTVGRCILGLEQTTLGEIIYNEMPLHQFREKEWLPVRPKVQMVFQDPFDSVHPRLPISKVLEQPLFMKREMSALDRKDRMHELIEMVRLPRDIKDKFSHELTGGQLQRIGVARAIATDPALIILDEPTSVLDVAVRGEILKLLQQLQQMNGYSYIFISHDLSAVRHISDRVAIMYLGKIVEMASTKDIFREQHHPYSRALLSAALFPDPKRKPEPFKLSGEIPSPVNLPTGCYLYSRCPYASDACTSQMPVLKQVAPGHYSACLLEEVV